MRREVGEQCHAPLDVEQRQEFERIATGTPFRGVKPMNTTWIDKGQQIVLLRQIEKRFGPASQEIKSRIEHLSTVELERLAEEILDAKSLKDLKLTADE